MATGAGKRGIKSYSHNGEVLTKYGDAFKSFGGIDTFDGELETHLATSIGVGHSVGKLMHDEDTLAGGHIVGRKTAKTGIVESETLVDNLDEDAATAVAEGDGDYLISVGLITMDNGILNSLQRSNADGRIVATHIMEVAKMEKAFLYLRKKGFIRLYYKGFCHGRLYIFRLQIY